MRQMKGLIVPALIVAAGAANAMGASQVFNLGNLAVGDIPNNVNETALGMIPFGANRAVFTTDWVAGGGDPWSNEAIWAITDGPLVSALNFYADPGAAPNSAGNGNSVTLMWDVTIISQGYDPVSGGVPSGVPLTFIAGQTFAGSNAFWNNSVLTLSDDGVLPTMPSNFIDLGIVANENTPFVIDTLGSDFDTELAFFNSVGGLADTDDDGAGMLLSQLNVPGLPAGMYLINAGGFNTIYGAGGWEAVVDSFGSDGGNLNINIDGMSVYSGALAADTNQFFKITVVPTPGSFGLLAFAGLAAVRRRR